MNTLIQFKISNEENIKILIPDVSEKFNYFYKPTEKPHRFDEVITVYSTKEKDIILKVYMLVDSLHKLYNSLLFILKHEMILPDNIQPGTLSLINNYDIYFFDTESYHIYKPSFKYEELWLFSSQDVQTWIYEQNNQIYLEISTTYPFLHREPEVFEQFISFENFMKDYKPLALIKLDNETILEWKEQARRFIEIVDGKKVIDGEFV